MSNEGYERVQTAMRLEPTDRIPVVPTLLPEPAAGLAGVLLGDMVKDNTLVVETIFKVFDEYGGWDAIYPGFYIPIQLQVMGNFPMKMSISGQELAPDIPFQLNEQEILQVEDYDRIAEIGYDKFFQEDYLWRITKATPDEVKKHMDQLIAADGLFTRCCANRNISRLFTGNGTHPFFTLSLMRSMVPFTQDVYYNPEPVERALQRMTDDLIAAKLAEMKHWDSNIWLFTEERAGGYFFSPKMFERFWWPYTRQIVEAMWEHGIVTLFHLDTCWDKNLAYFKQLPRGSIALELDGTTDLALAKEILNDHACLKGDVPAALLALGTPEEVASYCKEKIDIVGAGGGYILGTGCSVPPNVKPENFRAMIDTAKNYRPKAVL
ncbi:MAG: hypothetical protein HOC23_02220 [Halieaceae bacterium]|jgi:uroporphyrinogen-III decarboxylase|nr:hypothetical protein [Halieaceae bacterium]